jgi:hypothetical protein
MKDSNTARITKRAKRTDDSRGEPSAVTDDQRLVAAIKSNWQRIDEAVGEFERSISANPRRERQCFDMCMARILEIIPWAARADVVLIIGLWGKIAASRNGGTSGESPPC